MSNFGNVTVELGISSVTIVLNVGVAAAPVVGPANTVFAVWVFKVGTKVPEAVIGDPVTDVLKTTLSPVMATLVTVPAPLPLKDVQSADVRNHLFDPLAACPLV